MAKQTKVVLPKQKEEIKKEEPKKVEPKKEEAKPKGQAKISDGTVSLNLKGEYTVAGKVYTGPVKVPFSTAQVLAEMEGKYLARREYEKSENSKNYVKK